MNYHLLNINPQYGGHVISLGDWALGRFFCVVGEKLGVAACCLNFACGIEKLQDEPVGAAHQSLALNGNRPLYLSAGVGVRLRM